MKKQKLRPGLSGLSLPLQQAGKVLHPVVKKVTVTEYLDCWGAKPSKEEIDLSPAPHRCLPEPISTAWENYDEEG